MKVSWMINPNWMEKKCSKTPTRDDIRGMCYGICISDLQIKKIIRLGCLWDTSQKCGMFSWGKLSTSLWAHCTCLRSARHRPNQHANESKTSHCNVAAILRIHHSGRLTIFDGDWNLFFLWLVYAIALLTNTPIAFWSIYPHDMGRGIGGTDQSRQRMKFREWRNDMKLPKLALKEIHYIYIHIYIYKYKCNTIYICSPPMIYPNDPQWRFTFSFPISHLWYNFRIPLIFLWYNFWMPSNTSIL